MEIKCRLRIYLILLSIISCPEYAAAMEYGQKPDRDALLDDELSWLQAEAVVYSAARREQQVMNTASAVFVLTNEEIHRSGATTVPDALRRVPGLDVAQINANVWAITSRGFNGRTANKLLVMIDGRTVYNPIFSGTIWRTKDVLLEDVDRIEVIRGPGAAMWGANAVNGVINVITKSSRQTRGAYVTAGGGNQERAFAAIRYGGKIAESADYRAYVKYNNRDDNKLESGANAEDKWENIQGGFRIDANPSVKDSFTLQGDIYSGNAGGITNNTAPVAPFSFQDNRKEDFSGGNILGRWNHIYSDTSAMSLQLYYDRTKDKSSSTVLSNNFLQSIINTVDIDFQHNFRFLQRNDITWGLGYRYIADEIHNAINFSFDPADRDYHLFSAFIQDDISIIANKLNLIIGSKFEHNDFSGFEIQPNIRLLYTPTDKQTVWASVSRAVRTPNRLDHNLLDAYLLQLEASTFVVGTGNSDFESENLLAYELGYRIRATERLFFDIAAFYNDYDRLSRRETAQPKVNTDYGSPQVLIPIYPVNKRTGDTYGVEISTDWQPLDWWKLQGGYSFLQVKLHNSYDNLTTMTPEQTAATARGEGNSPHHQFMLTSSMNVWQNTQFDTFLRYVDKLPGHDIDSYVELDVRLGWKPVDYLELAVVGQNLLQGGHTEFREGILSAPVVEIQRSIYGQISFRY